MAMVLLSKLPRQTKVTGSLLWEPAGREDSGQLFSEIREIVAEWPELDRAIVGGILQGMGRGEVAAEVGVCRRTVHRVLRRLQKEILVI
jgi:hypothetical protein